jgi:hypothetical protein
MDMSRKLMMFLSSSSMVNWIVGEMSLNSWSSICLSVVLGLYRIRISSTYLKYPTIWWCVRMLNICESCRYTVFRKIWMKLGRPWPVLRFVDGLCFGV